MSSNLIDWYVDSLFDSAGFCIECGRMITGHTWARIKLMKYCSKKCREIARRRRISANPQHKLYNKKSRVKRRLLCIYHYGGNPPQCACCGEKHIEFLTIDHNKQIPDKKHRSGDNLYGWLIRNKFPNGFRVLCLNCNHYIGHYGWCPHERKN